MKAAIYRPMRAHGSWRPRCPVDMRGPRFPEEYRVILALEAKNIEDVEAQQPLTTGDIVLIGDGGGLIAYVAGPCGCELVEFGSECRSPE